MNERNDRYEDSIGAYLLDALSELERQALERHLDGCASCREQAERLRPAADALARSVAPVEPPPSLKASLMEVVEREAAERGTAGRRTIADRLVRVLPLGRRPAAAALSALALLAGGGAAGFGLARLLSDDGARTLTAQVDRARIPAASGSLVLPDDGPAVLRVSGLPTLRRGSVYQVWLERDGEVVPQSLFEVGDSGDGAAGIAEPLGDADAVLVTREPAGGSRAPSERPILRVRL